MVWLLREQGITIDVAHIYFSATKSYIIADTPGHVEYAKHGYRAFDFASFYHFD
jgi:sulfate adenylyltransferase subunit 1 (EFTu-like GTPase family)